MFGSFPGHLRRRGRRAQTQRAVLILADDLGWTDLGCYGSDFYRTPHLDHRVSISTSPARTWVRRRAVTSRPGKSRRCPRARRASISPTSMSGSPVGESGRSPLKGRRKFSLRFSRRRLVGEVEHQRQRQPRLAADFTLSTLAARYSHHVYVQLRGDGRLRAAQLSLALVVGGRGDTVGMAHGLRQIRRPALMSSFAVSPGASELRARNASMRS